MKIGIISGSHRGGQSQKIAQFIQKKLSKHPQSTASEDAATSFVLDISKTPLPLWDEGMWENGNERWDDIWGEHSKALKSADGFVVVCPEWSGMVPAGLKNLFLLCGKFELAHKPALIVAVSSSTGGAYPVAELRMSSYKNTRICFLPEHLIVRDVEKVMNTMDAPVDPPDIYIQKRLDYCLDILLEYTKQLRHVRTSGVIRHQDYPNGM